MAAETFGSSIPELARNQLKVREKFFSKESKSVQELQYLNSNVAWVKLRSSVNEVYDPDERKRAVPSTKTQDLNQGEQGPLNQVEGSKLAKKLILISGTQTKGLGARSGINFGSGFSSTDAYNTDTRLGTRPMPGLTSFKVASKGTYGTLQQAELEFNVWSLRDLNIIEKIYFRVGYSVVVEWGHSVYITDSENIKTAGPDSTISDNDYFSNGLDYESIEEKLQSKRKTYNGNYDGFLGLIQNFSWSLRSDGGYDCSIKVVSKGFVLESLTLGKASDAFSKTTITGKETTLRARRSVFHAIYEGIKTETTKTLFEGKAALRGLKGYDTNAITGLREFDVLRFKSNVGDVAFTRFFTPGHFFYVPLRNFLDIMNNFILIKAMKEGGEQPRNIIEFDLDSEEKYSTSPRHYSADPGTSFTVNPPTEAPYANYAININKEQQQFKYGENKSNIILDLPINLDIILNEVDNIIDSDEKEEEVGALDLIKTILAKIQRALGDVNDFDIQIAQTSKGIDRYIIVDRENINNGTPPTINLTGLKSTVVDLNVSSKISSAIASQTALAAQGSSGTDPSAIGGLLDWNKGLIDRHAPVKGKTPKTAAQIKAEADQAKAEAEAKKEEEERLKEVRKDIDKVFLKLNEPGIGGGYDRDEFDNVFQEMVSEINSNDSLYNSAPLSTGVVPIELSIKMLGLSGMKIGTTFKISDTSLPNKYQKRFGFIITGLDHEVGTDNKWYTNIKSQFYVLKQ